MKQERKKDGRRARHADSRAKHELFKNMSKIHSYGEVLDIYKKEIKRGKAQ